MTDRLTALVEGTVLAMGEHSAPDDALRAAPKYRTRSAVTPIGRRSESVSPGQACPGDDKRAEREHHGIGTSMNVDRIPEMSERGPAVATE